MAQQVRDEQGMIHNFPDEATPQQMEEMILSQQKPVAMRQIEEGQKYTPSSLLDSLRNNLMAGSMSAISGMANALPDLGKYMPGKQEGNRPLENFDPYKFNHVEDKPFTTLPGAIQTIGAMSVPFPGGKVRQAYRNTKEIAGDIANQFSPGKEAASLSENISKELEKNNTHESAKNLMSDLAPGIGNTQQATKYLTDTIKDRFKDRISQPKTYYEFIDEQAKDGKLYEKVNPLISTAMDKEKNIMNKISDLNVGDLYEKFKSNPSYSNAHALQSELGTMMGDLQNQVRMGTATRAELGKVKSVRDLLKNDIRDFLDRKGQETGHNLSGMYDKATELWQKDVEPYFATKKLRDITKKGLTSVPNVEKIFENPGEIENMTTGEMKPNHVTKILQDLPEEAKNAILFKRAGGLKDIENPGKLANKLQSELNTNYSHLDSPQLRDRLSEILSKKENEDILNKAQKYATGDYANKNVGLNLKNQLNEINPNLSEQIQSVLNKQRNKKYLHKALLGTGIVELGHLGLKDYLK